MYQTLALELDWLAEAVRARIDAYLTNQEAELPEAPVMPENGSAYENIVKTLNLTEEQRLVLALALAPHLQPEVLDMLRLTPSGTTRPYTIFGGLVGKSHGGVLPTGETALFLLAGADTTRRIAYLDFFNITNPLFSSALIQFTESEAGEPELSGQLFISNEALRMVRTGEPIRPKYSSRFPAQVINTPLEWEDLVLSYDTWESLEELKAWLAHGQDLLSLPTIGRKIRRGYRCLFYGPPGTGKTLTASLLGKGFGLDVYRVDLSMVVSKYIGETEKNLKNVFDQAENKKWVLFFDEADSLFGKRVNTSSANDRYANQEISYLLQRIEDYPGLIILASNLKGNMDEAFTRRFQSVIYFPVPDASLRLTLWKKAFGEDMALAEDVDLRQIAKTHELSGGAISNVIRYCALMSLSRNERVISMEDLQEGIRRELQKEGKTG
ncbi:ATP-binding protein [Roseivirga sp. BDSF3-8]|uniref:ATP-binding protein n=1 Tax=Roseivirga sp. BDSF3-8 TaxID=3241598 RepID=UPI003531A38E